MAITH